MKQSRNSTTSLTSIFSIVFLYLLIVAVVIVLSQQLLTEFSFGFDASNALILGGALAFPAVLLVILLVQAFRLVRDRAAGRPGVGFKLRLLVFFGVVVLLASVPQAVLSITVINTVMSSWFGGGTGGALEGGLAASLRHYEAKVENLERVSERLSSIGENLIANPEDEWLDLRAINPDIDALQVFGPGREELFFGGAEAVRLDAHDLPAVRDGMVMRDSSAETSVLRVRTSVGGDAIVVLSIVLPAGFERSAELLTTARESFLQYERVQPVFLLLLVLFYALFSFPLILMAILVSFLLSDEIIRPIVQLEEATRRVAEGDFSIRILTRSKDDLSLLVDSFNRMVGELERARVKMKQTEKVAAWQEIAQRLAHEIKNPLTPIKLSAERLMRKYHAASEDFDATFEPAMRSIISEVENLNELLSEFRAFTRLPKPQRERVILRDLVDEAAAMYAHLQGHIIRYDSLAEDLEVVVDPKQMKQVFVNLFRNAFDAMNGEGGEVNISADLVTKGNTGYCRIRVQDSGRGIAPEHYDQVFNPYFTTKPDGTGLGLSIVERVVFDHDGHIWFETSESAGTTFFIDIPGAWSADESDTGNR